VKQLGEQFADASQEMDGAPIGHGVDGAFSATNDNPGRREVLAVDLDQTPLLFDRIPMWV
jgi:hypothetical protein